MITFGFGQQSVGGTGEGQWDRLWAGSPLVWQSSR